jgi:hypothetical protein
MAFYQRPPVKLFRAQVLAIAVTFSAVGCDTPSAGILATTGVTAPVVTSPPSTGSSSPSSSTGPGLSGLALISDDFSGYPNTAALQNRISSNIGGTGDWRTAFYNDGHNAQLASIDPNVQYNGHATLRYDMPGGTASIPELWPSLPRTLSTLWLRAKIRFGRGFTTTGTLTNSSNAYKLLGWGLSGVDGSGRLEITNTTQYDLYWGATKENGTTVVPNTDPGGGPQLRTEWSDSQWYDYIIEYQITSPTTAVARFWLAVDGQPPVLQMTRTRTAASGFTMPQANAVMLGLNFNQVRAATQSQQLWYGQWEVVDGVEHPNPFGLSDN